MSSSVTRWFSSSPRRYLVLLAAPLAGALWAGARARSAPPAARASAPPLAAGAAAPALRARCGFAPGERASYALRFDEEGTMDAGKLLPQQKAAGGVARMDLQVTGTLHLVGVSEQEGVSLVAGRFEGLHVADRSGRAGALDGVDRPLLLRMNARCGVEALARHRDTQPEAARRQQGMVLALEALLPERGERVYEAEQRDATGVFKARYGQGVIGGKPTIERRILGYERLWSAGQGKVLSSRAEIEPGDGPWFERLREETRVSLTAEGAAVGSLRVKKEAHRVAWAAAALDPSTLTLDEFVWGDALTPAPAEEPEDAQAAALTTAQALSGVDEALKGTGTRLSKAMRLLRSYLRAHPERASEVLLAARGGSEERLSMVLSALGQTGGEAAEKALLGVTSGKGWKDGDRVRSAAALAAMKGASVQTAEALRTLAQQRAGRDDLASGAALVALGAMAGQRSVATPEAAEVARAEVRRALAEARGREAASQALAAAGNAGLAEFLPDIERGLSDPDALVRAQAAQALRGFAPERTAATITARLSVEPDPAVRRAALDAASQQLDRPGAALPAEALTELVARLPREGDAAARAALVRLLGPAARTEPAVRAALVEQFRRETDASVLRVLGTILSAGEL